MRGLHVDGGGTFADGRGDEEESEEGAKEEGMLFAVTPEIFQKTEEEEYKVENVASKWELLRQGP